MDKRNFIGFERHEYNPVIREKTEKLFVEILKETKPKKILEIGTFIGYSAAIMLENSDAFVTSIEKDEQNAKDANQNLKNLGFSGRFEIVCADAMDYLQSVKHERFDLIFLDGPKGQYYKYLPYLKAMLNQGGVLIADDILFYGLVRSEEKIAHKHRSIVNNLRKFLEDLQNDNDFETTIYDFEDGVSVSYLSFGDKKGM